MLQKPLRAAGIRFQNTCEFWSGLGRGSGARGSGGGPLEKRSSNDAGSAARASAPWQSQGYGLRRQSEGVARFATVYCNILLQRRDSGTRWTGSWLVQRAQCEKAHETIACSQGNKWLLVNDCNSSPTQLV